jgi:molecular chaperone DnaK
MPYVLGVDVGNSRTAAATCRLGDPRCGEADTVPLGMRSDSMASAVYLAPDGTVVVGDAAERHAPTEPGAVARGFLGRMGDDIPLMVGGEPCTPQDLVAAMVMWVVEQTAGIHGGPAEHIVLTHPASWGSYRRMLLHQALRRAGLSSITLLPEPIAAGEGHATRAKVASGDRLAIYHLGADSFAASVIRRTDAGTFELLGNTDGTELLGGTHFDDALVDHVRGKLGKAARDLDPFDPQVRFAMARLRQECTEARRRLAGELRTTIPNQLTGSPPSVEVSRGEFDSLIRLAVETTVDTLRRTVRRAPGDRLDAVLLIGEAAAIPLVGELVTAEVPCRVVRVPNPAHALAISAALAARRLVTNEAPPGEPAAPPGDALAPPPSTELTSVVVDLDLGDEEEAPPPRPSIEITPPELPEKPSPMRRFTGSRSGSAGVLAALAGALALLAPHGATGSPRSAVSPPPGPAFSWVIKNAPTGATQDADRSSGALPDDEQDKDGH